MTADTGIVQRLDELFAPWNRSDAPGFAVGVAQHGKTIYRRGFGMASLETSVAITPKTRMRIGSTSKHFTCLLALLLMEDGKLDIDAPIRTYIPELAGPGGDPSLRLLMQHRGGSRCYLDVGSLAHGFSLSPAGFALKTQVRQQGRNFAPGEAMIYNNGGYYLLSLAIERVGGAPFGQQLKQRLLDPLGMADTTLVSSDYEITPGMATMHIPRPGGGWTRGLFPTEEFMGEGAIVSTIDDMLRWTAHLRARDRFGSPATWEALVSLPRYGDGTMGQYALGLMVQDYRGLRTVHHGGGVYGGSSQMMTIPDHALDIVIHANGAPGAIPSKLAEKLIDIVLAEHVDAPAQAIQAKDFQALLGDWWSPETGMVYTLIDQQEKLALQVCKATYAMLDLVRTKDGLIVTPAHSLGEIELRMDPAADEIVVAFGGQSAKYRRLNDSAEARAAFATAAVGEYVSNDGGATAIISMDGDRLFIRFADSHGFTEVDVAAACDVAAVTTASGMLALSGCASINLIENGATAEGFFLNTMRTRHLEFKRIGRDSEPSRSTS